VKNVWIDISEDIVVLFDSHTGQPITGWEGDQAWGLREAYKYVERWGFHVTHETVPLIDDATFDSTKE
jgi:hypothetical protein